MGTSAIYEYAAMAIEGSSMGASVLVTYIAVGPPHPDNADRHGLKDIKSSSSAKRKPQKRRAVPPHRAAGF